MNRAFVILVLLDCFCNAIMDIERRALAPPLILIGEDNATVFESAGNVTVCAQLVGYTTGTDIGIPIIFSPRVLLPPDLDKADTNDFDQTPQIVILRPGQNKVCTDIIINQDSRHENNETFCVDLSSNNTAVHFQPDTCQIKVTIFEDIRCINYLSDIMLVLDVSESLNSFEARSIKSFALNFIKQYPSISETTTNIGLIRFSDSVMLQVDIKLHEFLDKDALINAIDHISFHRNRGFFTHHLDAMKLAIQQIETGRPEAQDIIIFVTDGEPHPKNQSAIAISKDARENKNITIFAILIKPTPKSVEEVRQISGNNTFFTVDAVADLSDLIPDLIITNCEPVTVRFETRNVTVNESEGRVQVCLVKSEESIDDIKLDIGTRQRVPYSAGQDATIGEDFPYDRRTDVVFHRNADRLCLYFNITDDDIREPNEMFQITFNITSSPNIAVTDWSIENVTIIDDDIISYFSKIDATTTAQYMSSFMILSTGTLIAITTNTDSTYDHYNTHISTTTQYISITTNTDSTYDHYNTHISTTTQYISNSIESDTSVVITTTTIPPLEVTDNNSMSIGVIIGLIVMLSVAFIIIITMVFIVIFVYKKISSTSKWRRFKGNFDTSPESIVVTIPTDVSVPADALHDKILDESLATNDYELPVVTSDIPVTPCPLNATTTFTETEVKID